MVKLYCDTDTSLAEFAEEMEGRNPIFVYPYADYVLVSDVEIDPDDLDDVINKAIEDFEDSDDDDLDDDEL